MIAVGLITCERSELTERTAESFRRYNPDLSRFSLLHVDDASTDERNMEIARAHGFVTVHRNRERQGIMATRKALLEAVEADWLIMLGNDWESVRAFPWPLFESISSRRDIWALRLYGRFKERNAKRPAGTAHKGRCNKRIRWRSLEGAPEPAEIGLAHVGGSPVVVRAGTLRQVYRNVLTDPGASIASGPVVERTVRVVENVMFHIGFRRTPEFKE